MKITDIKIRKTVQDVVSKYLNEGLYSKEPAGGEIDPDADPNGYLDGVDDMEGIEHGGNDLFIVFDRNDTDSLSGIVHVERNDDIHREENHKWMSDRRFWCATGEVVDWSQFGKGIILFINLS